MSTLSLKFGSRLLFAAASLALLAACGGGEPAKPAEPAVVAKPFENPAWPATSVADATTLGFTAEGIAALDARLAKSVADGDVAGMVAILGKGDDIGRASCRERVSTIV